MSCVKCPWVQGRHEYAQESYLRTSRWHRKYSNSSNDEHRCQTLFAWSSKVWTSCPCVRIWPLYCRNPCLGESNGALEINCPSGGSEVCWLTCWVPRMEFYETLFQNEWNVLVCTFIWVLSRLLFSFCRIFEHSRTINIHLWKYSSYFHSSAQQNQLFWWFLINRVKNECKQKRSKFLRASWLLLLGPLLTFLLTW